MNKLLWGPEGELLHFVNGELRAVVCDLHAEDYCAELGLELPAPPDTQTDPAAGQD